MTWIGRQLAGRPWTLQAGTICLLLLSLLAVSLLLPFGRGLRHAPRAIADDGGYLFEVPQAANPAENTRLIAELTELTEAWEKQTNHARDLRREPRLSLHFETTHDESGREVLQLALAAANSTEALALAELLNSAAGRTPARVIAVAPGNSDAISVVRPLDDPANPYVGQYGELEHWIYDHAWSYAKLVEFRERCAAAGASGESPGIDTRFMAAYIDAEGWMQPIRPPIDHAASLDTSLSIREIERRKSEEMQQQARRPDGSGKRATLNSRQTIFSDPGSDQLYTQFRLATFDFSARQTARIPAWLAKDPPFHAVLVPNGEVVTYGQPGENPRPEFRAEGGANAPVLGWYRFNAAGELLEQHPGVDHPGGWSAESHNWVRFYWPAAREAAGSSLRSDFLAKSRYSGRYWVVMAEAASLTDTAAGGEELLAAYAYDGSPLELDSPLPPELCNGSIYLSGSTLSAIHAAQVEHNTWFGKESSVP